MASTAKEGCQIYYILYTGDIPICAGVITATFANDTVLLDARNNVQTATNSLQLTVNNVTKWAKSGLLNGMR